MTSPSIHTHTLDNCQSKDMALPEALVGHHLTKEVLAVGIMLKKEGGGRREREGAGPGGVGEEGGREEGGAGKGRRKRGGGGGERKGRGREDKLIDCR